MTEILLKNLIPNHSGFHYIVEAKNCVLFSVHTQPLKLILLILSTRITQPWPAGTGKLKQI